VPTSASASASASTKPATVPPTRSKASSSYAHNFAMVRAIRTLAGVRGACTCDVRMSSHGRRICVLPVCCLCAAVHAPQIRGSDTDVLGRKRHTGDSDTEGDAVKALIQMKALTDR
jgi:hypothetical protein